MVRLGIIPPRIDAAPKHCIHTVIRTVRRLAPSYVKWSYPLNWIVVAST